MTHLEVISFENEHISITSYELTIKEHESSSDIKKHVRESIEAYKAICKMVADISIEKLEE